MTDANEVDVLIIGAGKESLLSLSSVTNARFNLGISGVFAAKCYLDLHPESRLVILDRDSCVGGTWNSRESELLFIAPDLTLAKR